MANQTIYPYGVSEEAPEGIIPGRLANIEYSMQKLAPWAFRDAPNYPNAMYRDVMVQPKQTGQLAVLRYGYVSSLDNYIMSPIFQLGEEGDVFSLTFSVGTTVNNAYYPGLVFFTKNYDYYTYNVANSNPRTVSDTVAENGKYYVRLVFSNSRLLDSYLINAKTGEYLFRGDQVDTSAILNKEAYLASQYWLPGWGPNSRGDWIGWNFGGSDSAQTAQRTSYAYPLYREIGALATEWSHSASRVVEIPQTGVDIEFSCGVVDSGLMLRALNPESKTASYFSANENPRTVTVANTYTHLQLYFLKENYADCYIKDATNDVILWEGAATLD